MKKQILNTIAITLLATAFMACKGEKKNQTEASEAQEIAETTIEATEFKVNTDESVINWIGSKPTEDHSGTIALESGVMRVAGDEITGTFIIDMNTISVTDLEAGNGKESLEGHLKGTAKEKEDHFFNVAKYPTAAFEVTGVTEKDGTKIMQGNLTIRGIKKNIKFPVTYAVNGDAMELTSETFTINRTDWGVNYGSKSIFNDLGDKFIKDLIQIKISLKGTKA